MLASKLVQTLLLFDAHERQRFEDFLHSPFFFNGKKAPALSIHLYQYLNETIQQEPDACLLDRAYVYSCLFGNEEPVKGKLEKVMSHLQKCVEQFIAVCYSENQREEEQKKALVRFFRIKKADRYFKKATTQLEAYQKKIQRKDEDYFYNNYWLERERSHYLLFNNSRKDELNLKATIQHLDIFYFVTRLDLLNNLFAQNLYHSQADRAEHREKLEQWLPLLDVSALEQTPHILLKRKMLQFLAFDQDAHYEEVRALTNTWQHEIPEPELKVLAALFRNYSIWKYNHGASAYLEELFSLYQEHLSLGLLYYDGGLLPSTFKNLVDVGLKCKQFDWVLQFLQEYQHKIKGTLHPKEVYQYNLANYYFYSKAYEKALDLLSGQYEDIYYKIDARRLEIKIYYELQSPLLESRIEAFRIMILRLSAQQLTKVQREGNKNFVLILTQIMHYKTLHNSKRISKIRQNIKSRIVGDQQWLSEKLNQLALYRSKE